MRAVVFHGVGDIRLDDVKEPKLKEPADAIVRITASAICGTDLHLIRGTVRGVKPGTVLGHEGVGIVEEVGKEVRNFRKGDRVVIASTIACGTCVYCRAGYFSQCDQANPNGPHAGSAYFGGDGESGAFHGLQAELARVPFANVGMLRIPAEVSDDDAVLLSDIFPTGFFAAKLAEIKRGDTVCVFGCGPVGQLAIMSAFLLGAGRVLAVDDREDRLEKAAGQGAEVINFEKEDPVEVVRALSGGIGVDRAIDAVGVDAMSAHHGPAARKAKAHRKEFAEEVQSIAPGARPDGKNWSPGEAPSQALLWAVECLAKAGTLAIVGVYPPAATHFPIGEAMSKNLSINGGSCNHRKYMPQLMQWVRSGVCRPSEILTQRTSLDDAIAAYKAFDRREPGWTKVELKSAA